MNKVIWPERISLKYWADSLVSDFREENLPILTNVEDFEKWGKEVVTSPLFSRAGIPPPSIIKQGTIDEKWVKWAKIVYTLMGDEYNINTSEKQN